MSNLFGIGLSGLGAAQAGLTTTSGNISNVNTPGYTRRQTNLSEVAGNGGEPGGVRVDNIHRHYAQFLSNQLNNAQSTLSATNSHLDEISQIDDLLSDSDAGLAARMQDFFDSMSQLAGTPEDTAARNAVLGDAKDLASRFRSFSDTLSQKGQTVDHEISRAVDKLNGYAAGIADLNDQITTTRAKTGAEPNELLDQRDQLVAEASKLADVDVTVNDKGDYSLTVGNYSLVDAAGSHEFTTTVDPSDASRRQLAYKEPGGSLRIIGHDQIQGGKIGGLLDFKDNSLAPAQMKLDQTAHDFAAALNEQHAKGTDLNGDDGGDLFTTSEPQVRPGADNGGDAVLSASFTDGETDAVTASNYRVEYSDGEYTVTQADTGQTVASGDGDSPLSFGGVTLDLESGTPQDGDVFTVRPVENAASSFEVAVSDPAGLAAAGKDGPAGDNSNAKAMADLQQDKTVVEGNRSLADNYAQLVGDIGNKTQSLQVNADSQEALVGEVSQAQQSVSGVNLDEAYVNLMFYQQMYQANARVINTASTVFDSVLSLTR